MGRKDKNISLDHSIFPPHRVFNNSPAEQNSQLLPSGIKLPVCQSPVEIIQFLQIPQAELASSTWHCLHYKIYFSPQKFIDTSASRHEDSHILSSIQGFIFVNQTTIRKFSSHTHTLHPCIIKIDKANTLHHTFHAT